MLKNRKNVLIALWIIAISLGFHTLLRYKGKAASSGQPPSTWPRNEFISLSANKPLLLMFAHPRCPCTKASLAELEQLVEIAKTQFEAAVLFYEPKENSKAWSNTPLIDEARLVPGLRVILDRDGKLAKRFAVETSGHTLLYSPDGDLLFTGGITACRGHLGDNLGLAAVSRIIAKPSIRDRTSTPVFGCELFNQCTKNQTASRN